jgi:hypothetical protein
MKSVKDPVGRGNDAAIVKAARQAKLVVCAWGSHGTHLGRSSEVRDLLEKTELHILRLNAGGEPAHPLYLPASLKPTRWKT